MIFQYIRNYLLSMQVRKVKVGNKTFFINVVSWEDGVYDVSPPITGSANFRETEALDIRITEDGNIRILES